VRSLQPVRGTHDIPSLDVRRHRHIVEVARSTAGRYGFEEIATPIFEFSEVFRRTLGETSDIVAKEMYTFQDRGGEEVTLRPEYTAGIARAFISGGMAQDLPLKFFASGPMFRYERPQKGRLRQFHQIDVEILGVATPHADIEVVALGAHILSELGVADRVELEINSLGDAASRAAYRDELVARLRLTDVREIGPRRDEIEPVDADGMLWSRDPDRCCYLRKVAPLHQALDGCDGWITGRKRFQSAARARLSRIEAAEGRIKINPLADWGRDDIEGYVAEHGLPPHPLEADGFRSIGCMPCTDRVAHAEEARDGRWRGEAKTECGIHTHLATNVRSEAVRTWRRSVATAATWALKSGNASSETVEGGQSG